MLGQSSPRRRVLLLGGTGTIGRAVARALADEGYEAVCLVRGQSGAALHDGAIVRAGDATRRDSILRDGIKAERFDAIISCMASRTGAPRDAWAIDRDAQMEALAAALEASIGHFVLLSAICVQKPRLQFQHAKLAFEEVLIGAGLTYSIVRPTAYFKSLSGQIERVKAGNPFLLFGDGRLTATKPISDRDLAHYIVGCLDDAHRHDRILPIGGPGPAITPLEQGKALFRLLGREPRFSRVPVALMTGIIGVLGALGHVVPRLADKAELARIGRYYATESMLVLDPATGRYDADATPSTGSETLIDYYAQVLRGEATVERGAHAVV